jgi:type I restriction enzyme S subunit
VKEWKLPEGWEWNRLEESADINMGQSPSGTSYNENGEGTPFLQGNAEFGDTFPKHKKFTTEPSKIASKGSVLISVRAPVGDTNIADLNYCIGRGLASISLKNGDNKYLLYLLRSLKPMIESKSTGSTFKAISKSILNEMEIPLPPLPVQRQIVSVLEKAETLYWHRQKADALTEALLQSVFYDVFGDPVRNESKWVKKTLADICIKFEHGLYVPKERYVENNGIEMIHMSDAFYGEVKPGNLKQISATDKESEKYQLLENDLLVARRSLNFEGAAKPCKLPKKFGKLLFESSLIRIRPDEGCVDSEYLYQYLSNQTTRRKYVFPFVTSSTISGINQENLKKITVLLPPLALQHQFANIVAQVETVREKQKASGKEIKGLFEGLMQGAFSGELVEVEA